MKTFWLLWMMFFAPAMVSAQFVQFAVLVEPEVNIETELELNFGQLNLVDSVEISLDDARVGIFTINGLIYSLVGVSIDTPQYLVHREFKNCDADWCRIKVNLSYAWSNSGVLDVGRRNARVVAIDQYKANFFMPFQPQDAGQAQLNMLQMTIFVFGKAQTNDAIPGQYTGEVNLTIFYD
jgi:hypothetical protein